LYNVIVLYTKKEVNSMGRARGKVVATKGKSAKGNKGSRAAAKKHGDQVSGQKKSKQIGLGAGHVKRKKKKGE
jgi:hypothetical protein